MTRLLLPLALSVACASAAVLPHPAAAAAAAVVDGTAKKHISFPIVERRAVAVPSLQRRDNVVVATNHSNVAYMVELAIGTPGQKVRVQIDTGSNELWVNPDCSTVEDAGNRQFCKTLGQYEPADSSSSVEGFVYNEIAYGKGTVSLEYYLDDISITGSTTSSLSQVQFGVALSSDDAAVPILGVGIGYPNNTAYNNFIDELALQNVTNGRAFSLVLGTGAGDDDGDNPVGSNVENGAIIFGGIDTKKFYGPLQQYANLGPQDDESLYRYWVQLDSVGYRAPGKTNAKDRTTIADSSAPVLLDSGSSLNYLPDTVMDGLAKAFGVKQASEGGYLVVDCDYGSKGGAVDFVFGDLVISVPYSDLIWDAGNDSCIVGAVPASAVGGTALLGDTFLRSAFVVFDQDHQHIYLAQAANCGSNEHSLPASGNYNYTGECVAAAAASAAPGALAPLSSFSALAAFVAIPALLALL